MSSVNANRVRTPVRRAPKPGRHAMADQHDEIRRLNLGARRLPELAQANYPSADSIVREVLMGLPRREQAVDIVLANPPTPDGGLWIRTQHRVGRRTRENMVWPQVSLAQMAALLHPTYRVAIIDANAERMGWPEFTRRLDQLQPRYYLTQLTAPTLENDLYGCFLARARGAKTIAFGTHVTTIPRETMDPYPALDFILLGEPDLTLRDLVDHLEGKTAARPPDIQRLFDRHDPSYAPSLDDSGAGRLEGVKGLVWLRGETIVVNAQRPFIQDLDDLPIPMHERLPLQRYRSEEH